MSTVNITDQEKALLDLIAKGEAVRGSDPYTSLWPSTTEPLLPQMTLAEVDRFQTQRIRNGVSSSACGRYQFIRATLRDCVGYLGVDPLRTRFTPDIQDALIVARLKRVRKMDDWLAGDLSTDRFMIKLAQEFASFPVPYPMQGASRMLAKGESYYAGDSLNKSNHDPDTLYRELEDIKNGGVGSTATIPINSDGPSGALPATGTSPRTQTATAVSGGGVGSYNGGNPGSRPLPAKQLPASSGTVYRYRVIDPLDDRYDFRTGEKVKDILIHGTGAPAATPVVNGNIGPANVSTTNTGVAPPTQEDTSGAVETSGDTSTYDEAAVNSALTAGESNSADSYQDASKRKAEVQKSQQTPAATREPCPKPVTNRTNEPSASTGDASTKTIPKAEASSASKVENPIGKVYRSRKFAKRAADKYKMLNPGFAYKLRKEGTQWRVIPPGKG